MTEEEQRAKVVERAYAWLRTPYQNHARIIGVGVDCAQLPAAVYHEAGLIPSIEASYTAQWYMHRSEELYVDWVLRFAHEITRDEATAGDLGLWRFGRTFSHGAILVGGAQVIHAVRIERSVVLGDMSRDIDLLDRPARFFSVWGQNGR